MKNNTMNKYEQKLDGVTASAEVGEDNVVAVITDNRSTTRTTFEQRTSIDQNKLASMVWNIGMDSILNAAKHGMLQVLQDQGSNHIICSTGDELEHRKFQRRFFTTRERCLCRW